MTATTVLGMSWYVLLAILLCVAALVAVAIPLVGGAWALHHADDDDHDGGRGTRRQPRTPPG